MIDAFRNTTPGGYQKAVWKKIVMKQDPVSASDTQKVNLSVKCFLIRYFAAQCFERLTQYTTLKNEQTRCPKKTSLFKI